jgi:hypothetical protein
MEVNGHFVLGTHFIGGWVVPRAGLDAVVKGQKSPVLAGNRTAVFQPVAVTILPELPQLLNSGVICLTGECTRLESEPG